MGSEWMTSVKYTNIGVYKMEQLFLDFAEAISPALQTLLQGVLTLLAAQAVAWLNEQYKLKKSQLSKENQYLLDLVSTHAVRAAEQLYDDNQTKKEYAISIVEGTLLKSGVKLDIAQIVSAIESQVFLKKQLKG